MVGIFYGSTNGNTEHVAQKLKAALGGQAEGPFNILDGVAPLNNYPHLLLGISTWNEGELQEDWEVIWKDLESVNWAGRRVALFGCGDQIGYPDTFQDAMGILFTLLRERGAHMYGYTNPAGYTVGPGCKAIVNGWLCGLAIDEDNQPDQTEGRVAAWVQALRGDFLA